jgi:hypothetical protein
MLLSYTNPTKYIRNLPMNTSLPNSASVETGLRECLPMIGDSVWSRDDDVSAKGDNFDEKILVPTEEVRLSISIRAWQHSVNRFEAGFTKGWPFIKCGRWSEGDFCVECSRLVSDFHILRVFEEVRLIRVTGDLETSS